MDNGPTQKSERLPKLEFANNGKLKMNRHNMGIIFNKTNGHCAYCGMQLDPFSRWHMDHAIPKSQDGTTTYENLWPSCPKCNGSKNNRTVEEYRLAIPVRLAKKVEELMDLKNQLGPLAPNIDGLATQIIVAIQNYKVVFHFEQEQES